MNKRITYTEPIPQYDPVTHAYAGDERQTFSVTAANDAEYAQQMEILNDPTRGIIIVSIEDKPTEIDPTDQLRADVDYIAIMTGVDLDV